MSLGKRTQDVANKLNVDTSEELSELEEFSLVSKGKSSDKEVYEHNIESNDENVTIIPISDMHLGSTNSDLEKVELAADYINNKDNCYTLVLGDAAETATKTSVGMGLFEEDMHLRNQIMELNRILSPLADKGKLLGLHTGNHEFRSAVLTGLNPMEVLAGYLGVEYLGWQAFHRINVGSNSYYIMSTHGVGSGQTTGSKVNNAEKPSNIAPTLDLYLSGHSHMKSVHTKEVYYIDEENNLQPKEQYYVICGSFMKYFGGYAEMKVLPPTPTGFSRIELGVRNRYVAVTI